MPETSEWTKIPVKVLDGAHRPSFQGREGKFILRKGHIIINVDAMNVRNTLPSDKSAILQSDWSMDKLCRDSVVTRVNDDSRFCKKAYQISICGREIETGLSVTLSVRTKSHIVIEFPDRITSNVRYDRVLNILRENIMSKCISECDGRRFKPPKLPEYRKTRPWSRAETDTKKREFVEKEKVKIRKKNGVMQMECVVEYHKKAYGFHPDRSHDPSKDGDFRLQYFPFALVFFPDKDTRDLAATTIFERSKISTGSMSGWRMAEVEATPSLQFLEASGITPSAPLMVDLKYVSFPNMYHYMTDIEATMVFDPLAYRPRHKRTPDGRIEVIPAKVSPFMVGDDVTTIQRKRLASLDIECITPVKGGFPSADRMEDPIICIAIFIKDNFLQQEFGYTFCLPGVSRQRMPMEDQIEIEFEIIPCKNELDLLCRVRDTLHVDFDVDLITGWNTAGFDWSYIAGRIKILRADRGASRCTYISKEICTNCKFVLKTTTSQAHGTRTSVVPNAPLVIHFDMMVLIAKRFKYEKYTLNHVAKELLKKTKVDMPIPVMFEKWLSEDAVARREVAVYCAYDTVLPVRIWEKLLLDAQITALARVCTVLYGEVLNRGELWKSYSLMFVTAHKEGYILNEDPLLDKRPTWVLKRELEQEQVDCIALCKIEKKAVDTRLAEVRKRLGQKQSTPSYSPKDRLVDMQTRNSLIQEQAGCRSKLKRAEGGEVLKGSEDEEKGPRYEGAKVLDPKPGLYRFVATQDFAALYPNIIIESNLDTSTMTSVADMGLPGWDVREVPLGAGENGYFVQNVIGLLPLICKTLLAERRRAKKEMAAAYASGDVELGNVKNGEQLAIKLVANSQYGATGASEKSGKYTCLTVARAVTGRGRQLLEQTRSEVEKNANLVVIYGTMSYSVCILLITCFKQVTRTRL